MMTKSKIWLFSFGKSKSSFNVEKIVLIINKPVNVYIFIQTSGWPYGVYFIDLSIP